MINVAGISICLIFIAFIVNHKSISAADYYLTAINVLLAAFLGFDLLIANQFTPEFVLIYQLIPFLLYPFFFLYGLEVMRIRFDNKFVFFVPVTGLLLFMIADFYVVHTRSEAYAEQIYRYPTLTHHFFYKGQLVLTCIGQIWLLQQIKNYQVNLRNQYSFIGSFELRWLRIVTIVFLSMTILALVSYLIYNFYHTYFNIELVTRIINACTLLAVFYMSYHGIRLYASKPIVREVTVIEPEIVDEKKYSKSTLDKNTLQQIHTRLMDLFEKDKPYLEPQLQLMQVTQKLGISTHSLSQTINSVEGKSFYNFVNQYRIDHFKRLLTDPSNNKFSILALGLDSGFNSKASMNRIFKEFTGQTPSNFQRVQQGQVLQA